jgi:transposase
VLNQRSSLSSENDIYRLANLLKRPPSDYGFLGEVWTNADIRRLIEQAFGVSIPMTALERILRKIDWQKYQQKQQQVYQLQWWELRRQGWSVQAIASKYAVAPDKVEAVFSLSTAQVYPGRLSKRRSSIWAKLTEEQMRQLPELLLKLPSAYGLVGEVWTQKKIAQLIEQVYQVSFSPHYISYLLKRIRGKLRVDMTCHTW